MKLSATRTKFHFRPPRLPPSPHPPFLATLKRAFLPRSLAPLAPFTPPWLPTTLPPSIFPSPPRSLARSLPPSLPYSLLSLPRSLPRSLPSSLSLPRSMPPSLALLFCNYFPPSHPHHPSQPIHIDLTMYHISCGAAEPRVTWLFFIHNLFVVARKES